MILTVFFLSRCFMSYFGYLIFSGSITSVGEEREKELFFFCYRLLVIMCFLFGEVSSGSLGWSELFYCGTP